VAERDELSAIVVPGQVEHDRTEVGGRLAPVLDPARGPGQADERLLDEILGQTERVRRARRGNSLTSEQAVIQMGFLNEVQIAQALAAEADLPYVKINPLDLDLDLVTKALSGPFARRHGMVAISKTAEKITIAVHNPFAPFPFDDIRVLQSLQREPPMPRPVRLPARAAAS
jgi:hypothetical protein